MERAVAATLKNVRLGYHRRLSLRRQPPRPVFDNLSFTLYRGETLGVIGHNGAGKSTLLRLLAGVLRPDAGHIDLHGHTTALLSLNLGLDPQLSGRDNAILSALLLGFSSAQAKRLLPRIVAFSELGKAIDDPVRTYSAGMKTRLGFSVALHLQPDILLIDEVLGVGDLAFRRKSTQALEARIVSEQTVVLVSHQPEQLERLCDRVLWIDKGRLHRSGPPATLLSEYRASAAR